MVHLLVNKDNGREYPGSWLATSLSKYCSLLSRNLFALAVLLILVLPFTNHVAANIVMGLSVVLMLLAVASFLHEGRDRWCEAIYRRHLLRHLRQPRASESVFND